MTRKQSLIIRISLFAFGLAVIAVAFALFAPHLENGSIPARHKFFWFCIALEYVAFFCPFFFSHVTSAGFARKGPSLVMLWGTVISFNALCIVLSVLVLLRIFPLSLGIVLLLAFIFVAGILVFIGFAASSHVGAVESAERPVTDAKENLRNQASVLELKVSSLGDAAQAVSGRVKALAEEIRYTAPCSRSEALMLDNKIASLLRRCADLCSLSTADSAVRELERPLQELEALVRERKLYRD